MIAWIRQRITDLQRETRIQRLARLCGDAQTMGHRVTARVLWQAMAAQIAQRSPQQVARMERRIAEGPRSTAKRWLVAGYCRGLLPNRFVAGVFRLLNLRSV